MDRYLVAGAVKRPAQIDSAEAIRNIIAKVMTKDQFIEKFSWMNGKGPKTVAQNGDELTPEDILKFADENKSLGFYCENDIAVYKIYNLKDLT